MISNVQVPILSYELQFPPKNDGKNCLQLKLTKDTKREI